MSSTSGAVQGGMTGATAGAAGGPITALIGGVFGAISGIFAGSAATEAKRAARYQFWAAQEARAAVETQAESLERSVEKALLTRLEEKKMDVEAKMVIPPPGESFPVDSKTLMILGGVGLVVIYLIVR